MPAATKRQPVGTRTPKTKTLEILAFDARYVEAKLDKEACVIQHVAILRATSKGSSYPGARGRRYTEMALRSCARLSEGCKSYRDHQGYSEKYDMGSIRKTEDLIGYFEDCSLEGETVFGDLHYLKDTATKERVEALVEQMADKIGMSIHAMGTAWFDQEDMMEVVDDIKEMRSVDMVTEPGSTQNLFESRSGSSAVGAEAQDGHPKGKEKTMDFESLTLADLKEARPDLYASISKEVTEKQAQDGELQKLRDQVKSLTESNKQLKAQVDTATVQEQLRQRETKLAALVKESGLPDEVVTDTFKEALRATKDDAAARALLEDRKTLVIQATAGVRGMGAQSSTGVVTESKKVSDEEARKQYEEAVS